MANRSVVRCATHSSWALIKWLRREVHGEREHKLRVYSELVFGHQVIELATSTRKIQSHLHVTSLQGEDDCRGGQHTIHSCH